MKIEKATFIEELEKNLPAVFGRKKIEELSGGIINGRYLANKQSKGDGPPAIRYGKKICFTKESFLKWFEPQLTEID